MAETEWVTDVISSLQVELWAPTYNWILSPPCRDSNLNHVPLEFRPTLRHQAPKPEVWYRNREREEVVSFMHDPRGVDVFIYELRWYVNKQYIVYDIAMYWLGVLLTSRWISVDLKNAYCFGPFWFQVLGSHCHGSPHSMQMQGVW